MRPKYIKIFHPRNLISPKQIKEFKTPMATPRYVYDMYQEVPENISIDKLLEICQKAKEEEQNGSWRNLRWLIHHDFYDACIMGERLETPKELAKRLNIASKAKAKKENERELYEKLKAKYEKE